MKKLSFVVSIFISITMLLTALTATANQSAKASIPERSGLYDDPDHPGIKVRVIVHPQKETAKATSSLLVCDLADPDSLPVIAKGGWHLPATWTYNLNPNSVPSSVGGTNLPTIVGNGLTDWASAISNKVSFVRGSNTTKDRQAYDGKNIVAWGRTSGSTLGVTYIRYYSSTGLAVDIDTIMNKRVSWKWSGSNTCADTAAYDAENILTHELGHTMGLADEYDADDQNATMYGYGSKGEVKKTTLSTGDITGVTTIYP